MRATKMTQWHQAVAECGGYILLEAEMSNTWPEYKVRRRAMPDRRREVWEGATLLGFELAPYLDEDEGATSLYYI